MNKKIYILQAVLLAFISSCISLQSQAQFTPGRVVVLQVGDGLSPLSNAATPVFLKEFTTTGTAGITVNIPTTGASRLTMSGTSTSDGQITRSANGRFITLAGYDAAPGTASVTGTASSTVNRVIDTVNINAAVDRAAGTNSLYSGNNFRSAVRGNNADFWGAGGTSGTYYFGTTAAAGSIQNATVVNSRVINIFNNNLYLSTSSSTSPSVPGIWAFAGTPTTTSVPTLLFGTGTGSSPYAFAINPTGDVAYVADDRTSAAGGIQKWTLSGGTWSLASTFSPGTNIGARGLAVDFSGTNPVIYTTTTDNRLFSFTDAGGVPTGTLIATAPTNTAFRGVVLAPAIQLPTVSLTVSTSSGSEAGTTVITVTATASEAVTSNQTVSLAVTGTGITPEDYILSNTTITIPSGATTGTVTFTIRNDAETEGPETATLTISSPSAGIVLGSPVSRNVIINDFTCQYLMRKSSATSTNGAEIAAFDSASARLYVVAGTAMEYYTINNIGTISSPTNLPFGFTPPAGTNALPNSVATKNGIVAVAYAIVDATTQAQQQGKVVFYNAATGTYINDVTVGYLPDMVAFSPDGTKVLTANEGEPNSYGQPTSFDPEGSVSIIDIASGVGTATVTTADFTSYNSQLASLKAAGVRIYGPGATVAQDLEPEYITFSNDGTKAIVTLQENNAVAEVTIATATVTQILPLGLKNHNIAGNGLDASDQDGTGPAKINILNWPVQGMYQPDAITAYHFAGTTYYFTANEGDARSYTGFNEEIRVGAAGYVLDPTVFTNATTLKLNANLGRLQVSNATGDTDGDGDFDQIHALGARSFSVWTLGSGSFTRIFDSGSQLEQITATQNPNGFNSDGTVATFDSRSDNKGPEPEAIAVGVVNGVPLLFVGSERTGDIFVYDITNPAAPTFVQYIDNPTDLQVEGLLFIPAQESPTGKALVIASAEVSRTVSVYEFSLIPNALASSYLNNASKQGVVTSYGTCQGLIANIAQAGGTPISGFNNNLAQVWIESSVPSYNSQPFVQRHYEIALATNSNAATGRVTLFFTQGEFDNFNTDPTSALDLPTGPTDVLGIANLRVIRYPGVGNSTGLPGTYGTTPETIDPVDTDIVWNPIYARWEVSFLTTGFGGFFVQTSTPTLPLTLLSFTAQVQGNDAQVKWTSTNEINHAYYEVQYSIDGRNFNNAGQRAAQSGYGDKNYTITHANAATIANKLYYRLKMVGTAGDIAYSNIVVVRFGKTNGVTDVYPNPAKNQLTIVVGGNASQLITLRVVDMSGRTLSTKQVSGGSTSNINMVDKAKGIYVLQAVLPDGTQQQYKLVKE